MQLKYSSNWAQFYLHCTSLQWSLPDKRMCSCHHRGNLIYRLHFLYTEMSCTDSVMERTIMIKSSCKICHAIRRGVDARNVVFLSLNGRLFSLKGGHDQKSPPTASVFQWLRKSSLVMSYTLTLFPELLRRRGHGNKVSISDTYLGEIINLASFVD